MGSKFASTLRRFMVLLLILVLNVSYVVVPSNATTTNGEPVVVPALREWTGSNGTFQLSSGTSICLDSTYYDELLPKANAFKEDLSLINPDLNLTVTTDDPTPQDLYFTLDCSDDGIGDEGYLMEIGDQVVIKANTANGAFFATRTLLQILLGSSNKDTLPKGSIRDYPAYPKRAFMIDVSRKYFTMDFLEDYVKMMSWLKMNDFHIHWTDDWYDGYWAFRIECETYPNMTATDGSYTKAEVIALQDLADIYGITITPEFDSPSHARPFTKVRPDLIYTPKGDRYLDLYNPDTYTFMYSLYDEYVPLFRAPDFHIGCDEYFGGGEKYRQYYNTMADYIQAKGKNVRAWTGWHTESGTTEPEPEITIDVWEGNFNVNKYIQRGNKLINSSGDFLYIVPDTSWLPDPPSLYETWEPHIFNKAKTNKVTPFHEQLLGAKLHIWLDGKRNIVTQQDCDELIQPPLKVLAERLWGRKGATDYDDFVIRTLEVGNPPGVDLVPTEPLPGVDPNNLAYNKNAVASSVEPNTSYTPNLAVDRYTTSRWSSGYNDAAYIYVDLGSVYPINRVLLNWEAAFGKQYKIQVSEDASTWIDVFTETNGDGEIDDIQFTSTNGRYVRMQGVERELKQWGYSLYDFQVFAGDTPPPSINVALNKPVVVSGVEPTTDFIGTYANDGNGATRWASGYDHSAWLYVDLGEVTPVTKVEIDWEVAFGKKYKIQTSNDAVTWSDVYLEENSDGATDTILLDTSGRYIKFQGIERATQWGFSIWEFKVFN